MRMSTWIRSSSLILSRSRPSTTMLPGLLLVQAEDRAQQHRLARARRADEAKDFAAINIEIEIVQHDMPAELHMDVAHR
jgi:hypothetical protein